jgi:hypothetical protein
MRWIFPIVLPALFTLPIAASADDKIPNDRLDQVQWKFSNFLTGSTLQIRDTINGNLEQQLKRKAEKTRRISDDTAAIAAKQLVAAAKLRTSSAAFAKLQDDLATANAQAAAAKKAGEPVAMITAQNQANELQEQITAQEDAAIGTDPGVIAKRKEIADTQAELHTLEPAIARATKARDDLMDALRLTRRIPGPPKVGSRGIIGKVKPIKIIDKQSFTTEFEAVEIKGEDQKGKPADGMKTLTGVSHYVTMMVTGVDTAKLHPGTETTLDRMFSITEIKQVGKQPMYVATPVVGDQREQEFDRLFELLDDLR